MKPGTTHRHRDKSGAKSRVAVMIRHSTFGIRHFSTPLSPHTPSHPGSDARPGRVRRAGSGSKYLAEIAEGKPPDYYLEIARKSTNGKGIKIVEIKSSGDLTTQLEKMPDASITSLDYFGHSNSDSMFLEYSSTPQSNGTHGADGKPLVVPIEPHTLDYWSTEDAKKVPKSRFVADATVSSYGCNQGNPGGFAEVVNKIWGVASKESAGKTDYEKAGMGGGPAYPDSEVRWTPSFGQLCE